MGESPIRGNVSHGDGVYKSTDGGQDLEERRARRTRSRSRACASTRRTRTSSTSRRRGTSGGPNAERGVFRSKDGGKTWKKVLFVDDKTGASDLVHGPDEPAHPLRGLLAGRAASRGSSSRAGPAAGLWKSDRRRRHLEEARGRASRGDRRATSASRSRPRGPERVWAIVEAEKGGLFRSRTTAARSGRASTTSTRSAQRAWYYTRIYADPKNADTRLRPERRLLHVERRRQDLREPIRVPHGDNHDLWIDPDDPRPDDRGQRRRRDVTFNGGRTWSTHHEPADGAVLSRHDRQPVPVLGLRRAAGQLDASPSRAACRATASASPTGTRSAAARAAGSRPSRRNPDIVYAGELRRLDHALRPPHAARRARSWPGRSSPIGHATKDLKYRFQWNAPILDLAARPERRSTTPRRSSCAAATRGETWEEISPGPDAQRQGEAGQVRAARSRTTITGVEVYDTIFALAESPLEKGVIWAGTDDGLVHVTRDDGKTWQNVTPEGDPRVDPDQLDRRLAARQGDGLRRGDDVQVRRLPALPLQDDRLREDLDEDRRTASRTAPSRASSARTRRAGACSTPAPRRASTSPSTTARAGSRSSATCRSCRSPT